MSNPLSFLIWKILSADIAFPISGGSNEPAARGFLFGGSGRVSDRCRREERHWSFSLCGGLLSRRRLLVLCGRTAQVRASQPICGEKKKFSKSVNHKDYSLVLGSLTDMPGQSTAALFTSPGVTTFRLGRTVETSWVTTRRSAVMCGRRDRPCLWLGAGTAWPPCTTSFTPSGAATITPTRPSASTSCRWSPLIHNATSGRAWRRYCCPTVRRASPSGPGGSMCWGATAGRAWRSPEPLRCTTQIKARGPEGRTSPSASLELRRVCVL